MERCGLTTEGGASGLTAGGKALAAAHARLLADPGLQFSFTPLPKPPEIKPPAWLKAIFDWIGHVAGHGV